MNDGSALVIFLVLQKIVEGQAVTVGGVSGAAHVVLHTVAGKPLSSATHAAAATGARAAEGSRLQVPLLLVLNNIRAVGRVGLLAARLVPMSWPCNREVLAHQQQTQCVDAALTVLDRPSLCVLLAGHCSVLPPGSGGDASRHRMRFPDILAAGTHLQVRPPARTPSTVRVASNLRLCALGVVLVSRGRHKLTPGVRQARRAQQGWHMHAVLCCVLSVSVCVHDGSLALQGPHPNNDRYPPERLLFILRCGPAGWGQRAACSCLQRLHYVPDRYACSTGFICRQTGDCRRQAHTPLHASPASHSCQPVAVRLRAWGCSNTLVAQSCNSVRQERARSVWVCVCVNGRRQHWRTPVKHTQLGIGVFPICCRWARHHHAC